MATKQKQVQTFGRKRAAVAVALCKEGKGLIRLNGQPLHLIEPVMMRVKAMEPVLLLGRDKFAGIDIRIRVTGGGHSSQVYAVRQAIAKAVIAYAQKCESTDPSPKDSAETGVRRLLVERAALCVQCDDSETTTEALVSRSRRRCC